MQQGLTVDRTNLEPIVVVLKHSGLSLVSACSEISAVLGITIVLLSTSSSTQCLLVGSQGKHTLALVAIDKLLITIIAKTIHAVLSHISWCQLSLSKCCYSTREPIGCGRSLCCSIQ